MLTKKNNKICFPNGEVVMENGFFSFSVCRNKFEIKIPKKGESFNILLYQIEGEKKSVLFENLEGVPTLYLPRGNEYLKLEFGMKISISRKEKILLCVEEKADWNIAFCEEDE